MCGIVAILDPRADGDALARDAAAMTGTLVHRGPDDHGVWCDPAEGIALGQQRLAIRDPSPDGHQPMGSTDGRWMLVYNGELYNAGELARRLGSPAFRGHSDTEVLCEAIAAWGVVATLERANGMFALAAWDRWRRELWLARDHIGIKPLHHGRAGSALVAGSELRALRAHPRFDPALDPQAVVETIDGQSPLGAHTIHRDARRLQPGHLLVARPGREPTPSRWWDPVWVATTARARPRLDDREAIDRLEAVLSDSVARQLVSDVPLGAFLSGGVDSSTVVALMRAQGHRVRTFAIGVADRRMDEADHAAAVARHLGTDHTELRVGEAELLEAVPAIVEHADEPLGDPSAIPTMLVSRLARGDVTVALSGDGGDELFGGYLTYQHAQRLWRTLRRVPLPLRQAAGALAGGAPTRTLSRMLPALLPGADPEQIRSRLERGVGTLGGTSDSDVLARLCTAWPAVGSPARSAAGHDGTALPVLDGDWSLLERMMLADLSGYLPETVLAKVDRASMSVGLEVRVPLLDPRVVALAWRLRDDQRQRDGRQKWALRQVLARYVPDALVDRPKQGFTVPVGAWLRGPLRGWAEDLLDPASLDELGMLDTAAVRRAWREHLAGAPRQDGLWSLLMLQAWRRRWT